MEDSVRMCDDRTNKMTDRMKVNGSAKCPYGKMTKIVSPSLG